MKVLKFMIYSLLTLLGACSESDMVKIDSLQIFGEEFYSSEIVKLGISVQTNDPENTQYKWECDNGKFIGTQGYSFNQWQAPIETGTYNIFCTVTCGNKSEKRQAQVKVSDFYFDKFNIDPKWDKSLTTTAQISDGVYLISSKAVSGTSNGTLAGYISKIFVTKTQPPINISFDYGLYDNSFSPKYPITAANMGGKASDADNQSAFYLLCAPPPASSEYVAYINSIGLEYWPAADKIQSSLLENKYEWNGNKLITNSKTFNKNEYDARFRFQWVLFKDKDKGIDFSSQGWYDIFVKIPNNALKFTTNKIASLTFSISKDNILSLYDNKNNLLGTTDELKNFYSSRNIAPILIEGIKFAMPSKTGMCLDNLEISRK